MNEFLKEGIIMFAQLSSYFFLPPPPPPPNFLEKCGITRPTQQKIKVLCNTLAKGTVIVGLAASIAISVRLTFNSMHNIHSGWAGHDGPSKLVLMQLDPMMVIQGLFVLCTSPLLLVGVLTNRISSTEILFHVAKHSLV